MKKKIKNEEIKLNKNMFLVILMHQRHKLLIKILHLFYYIYGVLFTCYVSTEYSIEKVSMYL